MRKNTARQLVKHSFQRMYHDTRNAILRVVWINGATSDFTFDVSDVPFADTNFFNVIDAVHEYAQERGWKYDRIDVTYNGHSAFITW
jgi:hypothetical protein